MKIAEKHYTDLFGKISEGQQLSLAERLLWSKLEAENKLEK